MPLASYNTMENLDLIDAKRSTKQQMETNQGDEKSPFDSEFVIHRQAVRAGNFDKAIQSFVLLKSNFMDNTIFQDYLLEVASNIDSLKDTELSLFFAALPCLLQSDIIDYVKERSTDMRGFQVLYDYIQAYPRHAYKYMTKAIQILLRTTQIGTLEERIKCAHLLVTDLFPRLCKQRLLLTYADASPSVKSTDSKHFIIVPWPLFETYIATGQQYYIEKRQWDELTKFTCMMVSCCGYSGFEQLHTVSHTIRFQHLKEHRQKIRTETGDDRTDDDAARLMVSATTMCESMTIISQFVSFGYDYYMAVCGENDSSRPGVEKTCLIPICAFKPIKGDAINDTSLSAPPSTESAHRQRQMEEAPSRLTNTNDQHCQKRMKMDQVAAAPGGQGLFAECMQGVDQALQILSKAADCLRHLVDLEQWASATCANLDTLKSWESELNRIIGDYRLPFDTKNAILLLQSDLALSSPSVPGNLAKALELSQTICDRIEVERRKGKSTQQTKSKAPELNIPFMFAFRVLYNIAVIYLLVGSIQQSTLEIAIILSVFPIPDEVDERAFVADEVDCNTIATIFQDHEFGLMRVNQVGLVARCIKHLVVSLDSESEQKGGMASIDAAMRWDEKAGNMIVLMQYGWPYWSSRTGMWDKILHRIKEKGSFKNREFLEYIYVEDVLKVIQSIHESRSAVLDIIPPEFALRASYRHLVAPHTTSTVHQNNRSVAGTSPASGSGGSENTDKRDNNSDGNKTHGNEEGDHDGDDDDDNDDDDDTTEAPSGRHAPPPTYQPTFANQVLPSMSMSPSWYAASTQKNAYANWMSPSFYYSRPATSVVLPKKRKRKRQDDGDDDDDDDKDHQQTDDRHQQHGEGYRPSSENGSAMTSLDRQHHQQSQELPRQTIHQAVSAVPPFVPRDIVSRCLDYRLRRYSPKVTPQRMRHVLQNFLKNMVLKGNDES